MPSVRSGQPDVTVVLCHKCGALKKPGLYDCLCRESVVQEARPAQDDNPAKFGPVFCGGCNTPHELGESCPECTRRWAQVVGKRDSPQASSPIPGIALVPSPVVYNVGWECPKCGRTFAPYVPHCDVCHQYPLRTFQPAGSPQLPFAPPWETVKVVCDAGTQITAT